MSFLKDRTLSINQLDSWFPNLCKHICTKPHPKEDTKRLPLKILWEKVWNKEGDRGWIISQLTPEYLLGHWTFSWLKEKKKIKKKIYIYIYVHYVNQFAYIMFFRVEKNVNKHGLNWQGGTNLKTDKSGRWWFATRILKDLIQTAEMGKHGMRRYMKEQKDQILWFLCFYFWT